MPVGASRASVSKERSSGVVPQRGFSAGESFARFRGIRAFPRPFSCHCPSYVPTEASGNPLDAETRGNARKLANRSAAHPGRDARRAEIFFTKTLGVKEGSSG